MSTILRFQNPRVTALRRPTGAVQLLRLGEKTIGSARLHSFNTEAEFNAWLAKARTITVTHERAILRFNHASKNVRVTALRLTDGSVRVLRFRTQTHAKTELPTFANEAKFQEWLDSDEKGARVWNRAD